MKNYIYKKVRLISLTLFVLLLPIIVASATTINQGTTKDFAILSGSTITNTGSTTVRGNIGLYPGTSFVNQEGVTVSGTVHLNNQVASAAKDDLLTAYNQLDGLLPVTRIESQLGGQTLLPGIYDSADGTFQITGTLILDGNGDPDAVFVFKTDSTLITEASSNVTVINSAQNCNVFWKVGTSATLGTNSYFVGNIYALTSITVTTEAEVDGKLLAMNGAVTLDTNTITNAVCEVAEGITNGDSTEPGINGNSQETVTGGDLPETSTKLYTLMFIGILLIVLGTATLLFSKRNYKNQN